MIIGFGHRSGVGKSEAAKCLSGVEVNIAQPVKEHAFRVFGIYGMMPASHYDLKREDRYKKLTRINKTPVEIWIELGEKLREIHEDLLIDIALRKCRIPQFDYLIPDVRSQNEIDAIRRAGGKVIKIEREVEPLSDTRLDDQLNDYQDWDAVIVNSGTLGEFKKEVIKTYEGLK